MQQEHVSDLVRRVLARHTGLRPHEITSAMRLGADLGLDSLDAVEILAAVEREAGRRFELHETAHFSTVGDFTRRIAGTPEPRAGDRHGV
jgi:acyl carrier protein